MHHASTEYLANSLLLVLLRVLLLLCVANSNPIQYWDYGISFIMTDTGWLKKTENCEADISPWKTVNLWNTIVKRGYLLHTDFLYSNTKVPEVPCSKIYHDSWPLDFSRDYVSKNFPVLIKGGCKDWAAVKKWDSEYFKEHFPEKDVVVTVTPNGYADGIANYNGQDCFFLPEEKSMKFENFLMILQEKKENYVAYIQQQNSNLTQHFSELIGDIQEELHWASKTFNKKPDAVNFWMGDERAVTSMHKDPYENIYCVIDGHKDFILIPPIDLPYVPYKNYPVKKYKNVERGGLFELESIPPENIFWVAVDPLNDDLVEVYPDFFDTARHFHVRAEKGDVLYLPSFWFHHVRQSHKCIAVNYWYDIDYYDPKYCYYRMLASLCDKDKYV